MATLNLLLRNDRAMVRCILNVKAKDKVSSDSLLLKRGIQNLDVVRHTSRLRCWDVLSAAQARFLRYAS